MFAEKGRKPNDFELAESTGEKVKNIQDYRIYFNSLVSMDAPVAGDQDLDYSEVLSDPQALSVEEEVEKEELSELISVDGTPYTEGKICNHQTVWFGWWEAANLSGDQQRH